MKMRIIFSIVFFFTPMLFAQAQRTGFLKSISYGYKSLLPTEDNGSIVNYMSGGNTVVISKLNANGFSDWERNLSGNNSGYKTIKLSDGNFLTGYTNLDSDICLAIYDSLGNSVNDFTYVDDGNLFAFKSITKTADSKLLILGKNNNQLYLQKTNYDGSIVWQKTYSINIASTSANYNIIQLQDLAYLISAENRLIKIDLHGSVVWVKDIEGINSIFPFATGYILTSKSGPISYYNLNDELIWENADLVNQFANFTFDGNIISMGDTTLSMINQSANIIWQKNIPEATDYFAPYSIYQANDGGYFLFVEYGNLLKTDANGNFSTVTIHVESFTHDKNLEAFGNANITWEQYNLSSNNIDLSYSTDLGNSWTYIVQYFPADSGSYVWQIPEINSENVYIKITDSNNPFTYDRTDPTISILVYQSYDFISTNNILMWFGNNGDGSNNQLTGNSGLDWPGGINATQGAVFEDGLLFGGKVNGEIRVNGSTYRHGLSPGIVLENGLPDNPKKTEYKIFKSKKNWQSLPEGAERNRLEYDYNNWPAELGAPINDIDNDGVYTPGVDNPYLGDEAFFYVNNSADSALSVYTYGSLPVPLEFQTIIWGYNQEGLEDVVFKKYKIINKGDVPITDMYLSYWTDDDLGFSGDDFVGVDTLLNLGYTYNGDENDDNFYGSPPPAVAHMMVQGPKVSASENDSAWFDSNWQKGYKNLSFTSFIDNIKGTFDFGDPILGVYLGTEEMYNYMRGYNKNGNPLTDQNTGDTTKFMVAGNPVNGTGWYEGDGWPNGPHPGDRRYMESSGPFTLAAGDTQEVAYAILMARGSDRLNSVTKLKEKAIFIQNFYNSIIIKSVKKRGEINPTKFVLNQNYPNPFNPNTTIKYFVPIFSNGDIPIIHLKIYDILGREIATLVNEKQSSGSHQIIFDASSVGGGLASGVYIYRLSTSGSKVQFAQAKKMLLLK